jgi:predicted kinase
VGRLIVLVGLPGSGKSSYAEQFKAVDDAICTGVTVIHSSDAIREELFGDAGSQEDNGRVFELMRKRTIEDLRADKTVIYDATNVTRKARKSAIACAHPTHDTVECHIVWAEPEECIRRDGLRDRKVGPAVIDKMLRRWQSPWLDEGFDKIEVHLNQYDFDQVKYVASKASDLHIPHDNPYHQLGVWDHCMQAHLNVIDQGVADEQSRYRKYNSVAKAAYWHDIGKPYTKFFKPGEDVAHYYDHHCVGGYLAYGLFLDPDHLIRDVEMSDICLISWIISNHMEPFFNSGYYQKLDSQWKWYIDTIHEADVNAH